MLCPVIHYDFIVCSTMYCSVHPTPAIISCSSSIPHQISHYYHHHCFFQLKVTQNNYLLTVYFLIIFSNLTLLNVRFIKVPISYFCKKSVMVKLLSHFNKFIIYIFFNFQRSHMYIHPVFYHGVIILKFLFLIFFLNCLHSPQCLKDSRGKQRFLDG